MEPRAQSPEQDAESRIREYRYLAKQMRAMVGALSHSEPRLTLLRLAEGYEKMAQMLEDNSAA